MFMDLYEFEASLSYVVKGKSKIMFACRGEVGGLGGPGLNLGSGKDRQVTG